MKSWKQLPRLEAIFQPVSTWFGHGGLHIGIHGSASASLPRLGLIIFAFTFALSSVGARVFAARGKRLCCPPPPSGVFRNLKRYISGVHFQKFLNFSIFFKVNISTIFFHIQRCLGVGVPCSIWPWSLQSDRQLIFLWLRGDSGVECVCEK